MTKKSRPWILLAWTLLAIQGYFFHETWRDEAQAWLVAKSSSTIYELLLRSSMEATGPLYYLGLWPITQFFPQSFPHSLWIYSSAGSFLAVWRILQVFRNQLFVGTLLVFGFFVGFELGAISRLYGWGVFFLFSGILSFERKRLGHAFFYFSLCPLLQLSLVFACFPIIAAETWENRKRLKPYLIGASIFVASLLIAYFHQSLSANTKEWTLWALPQKLSLVGSSLAMPFLNSSYQVGIGGLALLLFGLLCLPLRKSLLFCTGLFPFFLIFLCHYSHYAGPAQARHAGALHLVWVFFVATELQLGRLSRKKSFFFFALLAASVVSSLHIRYRDAILSYSDQLPIARKIEELQIEEPELIPWIYINDEIYGSVIASTLGEPLYSGIQYRPYFYPQFTKENLQYRMQNWSRVPWSDIALKCREMRQRLCLVVTRKNILPPPERLGFEHIYHATETISDESLHLYVSDTR